MENELRLYHYSIPFHAPLKTSENVITEREGLILGNDQDIWTEIAPLPGFSGETKDDVQEFLKNHGNRLQACFRTHTLDLFLRDMSARGLTARLPSVRFGLSMLREQQLATKAGLPLFAWWLHKRKPSCRIRCNATIGLTKKTDLLYKIADLRESGFVTVKVKLPPDPDQSFDWIHAVCTHFPDLKFRFDANRSFPPKKAHLLFKRLQKVRKHNGSCSNLEYMEEPLRTCEFEAKNPSDAHSIALEMAKLSQYGIPIAADESARTPAQVRTLLTNNAVNAFVLKPMIFGSFEEMAIFHESKSVPLIISSSFETNIGRFLLAHLAAFFNVRREADHGLATGDFFTIDIPVHEYGSGNLLKIRNNPFIRLPEDNGIGIRPEISSARITFKHIPLA